MEESTDVRGAATGTSTLESAATGKSTVESAETDESTVVYHPGDEEYVNWGMIKPPGEPPDDEDQREAVHEMLKWKRVTDDDATAKS
ncbi:hypothetical protein KFL_017430010 [Klebsormidium nitens]|uniref:Uncharacterized protein n=1 Tax=Klebsormidium nitens TaxID=105231 RepID=A0A1Y1IVI3_KLENI|nr:hypothetical protein KFL_017430010 [Klebsormidium nitens]|eukprot:GAQ93639.1 hypothetical protein KFL_017430010 [Klebsormidium nitens]